MVTKRENEALPKINDLKKQIKVLEKKYDKLGASVGYDELQGFKPNPRIEAQYGWIYAWLFPLRNYLNNQKDISGEVKIKISAIVTAIIAQLTIYGKYGIKIPNEPKEYDGNFFEKNIKYYELNYDACDICGEDRITHQSHIIPKAEGGANHKDNFVTLCPLHHHLFDHHRLNQEEWDKLLKVIQNKMPSAYLYATEIREKELQGYWANPKRIYPREGK